MFYGLSNLNIELTSRCNKSCWMCGRRKTERLYPEFCNWGDMEFSLVKTLAGQIPPDIVVQFHWNGEPLLYPKLAEALDLFNHTIRQFDTNGKLLIQRAEDIIERLEILTISVFENDKEADEQYQAVCEFIEMKGITKPRLVYRLLGDVKDMQRWEELPGRVVHRILHAPEGSYSYIKSVTLPEIGICLDLLHHLAIDRFGNVSPCVRYDPTGLGILGQIKGVTTLRDIWNGEARRQHILRHLADRRDLCALCSKCDYWGVPTG